MVEMDVRLTADGHPIVIHDATLDRTTNGAGPVAERALAGIQALDAAARFGPAFAGERVPTLAEALGGDGATRRRGDGATGNRGTGSTRWLVELKQGGGPPERLVERALEAIEAAGAAGVVRLISFDEALLAEALRQAPAIPRGIISASDPVFLLAAAEQLVCIAVHLAGALLTPEFVATAHAAGRVVNAWTLNSADDIRNAARLGVDEITSDVPDVAVAVLGEVG
jgi:glycerophosphoryl diester phosphodiesterase